MVFNKIYLNEKSHPKECVEAEGSARVASACVIMAGQVTTAPAPWTQLHVGQATACCATVKAHASVGYVNVSCHTQVPPVRPAPFARARVCNTAHAQSAVRSGQEQLRIGETSLIQDVCIRYFNEIF